MARDGKFPPDGFRKSLPEIDGKSGLNPINIHGERWPFNSADCQ